MSESEEPDVEKPKKPRKPKRGRAGGRGTPRGPIGVRASGKWYYAYDLSYVPCGVLLRLHDRQVVVPVSKPVEIYNAPTVALDGDSAMPAATPRARRAFYDPQLPHNEHGNLTMQELEEREERRRRQVEQFREEKNAELAEATGEGFFESPPLRVIGS